MEGNNHGFLSSRMSATASRRSAADVPARLLIPGSQVRSLSGRVSESPARAGAFSTRGLGRSIHVATDEATDTLRTRYFRADPRPKNSTATTRLGGFPRPVNPSHNTRHANRAACLSRCVLDEAHEAFVRPVLGEGGLAVGRRPVAPYGSAAFFLYRFPCSLPQRREVTVEFEMAR